MLPVLSHHLFGWEAASSRPLVHWRSVFALPLRATIEFPGSNPLVIFVICERRGFLSAMIVKLIALGTIGKFPCSAESTLTV